MKKIILLILCTVLLLFGCSNKENEISSTTELTTTEISTESTTVIETTSILSSTISEYTTEIINTGKVSSKKTSKGIEISYDNKIYTVQLENAEKIVDIISDDFDYDGIDDIFLNYDKYSQQFKQGEYLHYDAQTDNFIKWEELNEISYGYLVGKENDETISLKLYNYYGDTTCYYKWENSNPIPIKLIDYDLSSGYGILDYYEYTEENEKIPYLRKIQNISDDKIFKTIEYPYYFHVNETSFDILKNGEIIQTIEDDSVYNYVQYIKNVYSKKVPMEGGVREPEKYILCLDYDFDGYPDLSFPDFTETNDIISVINYKYYHFDAEAENFVPWQELNDIGKSMMPDYSNDTLRCFGQSDGYYIYQWKNVSPVIIRHEVIEYLDGYADYYKHIYDVDENSNETLIETQHYQYGEKN